VYLQSYDKEVVKLQSTTQLFLLDGKVLTENFYITPSNQYQHILISTTHIYVLFKPLAHMTVIIPCVGSDIFYTFMISFHIFNVFNLCIYIPDDGQIVG